MDIERINDHTVKFYISYVDIEERGFSREEIWYNRERSEELFWDMMDEVNEEDEFQVEGPLWIQVSALDKGIEVVVTKAQVSEDGNKLELPIGDLNVREVFSDERIGALIEEHFQPINLEAEAKNQLAKADPLQFVIRFVEFDDLIALAEQQTFEDLTTSVYAFEGRYYLFVEFPDTMSEKKVENALSVILEFGIESPVTVHRLEEYGKVVAEDQGLAILKQYFAK